MSIAQEFEPRFAHPLPMVVATWSEQTPDAPFLIDAESGQTLSYADVDLTADRWTRAIAGLGVEYKDIVLTMLTNVPGTVEVSLGIQWRRGIEFAVQTSYRAEMLAHAFEVATPKVAIIDGRFRDAFRGIEDHLGRLNALVIVGDAAGWDDVPVQPLSAEELLAAYTDDSSFGKLRTMPEWSDIGIIHLTSGTTGPSKGVMQYWRQMYKTATGTPGDLPGLGQEARWYSPYSMAGSARPEGLHDGAARRLGGPAHQFPHPGLLAGCAHVRLHPHTTRTNYRQLHHEPAALGYRPQPPASVCADGSSHR